MGGGRGQRLDDTGSTSARHVRRIWGRRSNSHAASLPVHEIELHGARHAEKRERDRGEGEETRHLDAHRRGLVSRCVPGAVTQCRDLLPDRVVQLGDKNCARFGARPRFLGNAPTCLITWDQSARQAAWRLAMTR
jgi:hypothetical protein